MHAQTQAARQTPLPIPFPASLAPTDDAGAWSFVAGALRAFGADAPAAPALAVPPLVETGLDALNAVGQAAVNAAAALDSAVESLFVAWGSPAAARKAAAARREQEEGVGSARVAAGAGARAGWPAADWGDDGGDDDDGWDAAPPPAAKAAASGLSRTPLMPVANGAAARQAGRRPAGGKPTPAHPSPPAGPASPEVADLRAKLATLAAENESLKRGGSPAASPSPPAADAARRTPLSTAADAMLASQLQALLADKARLAAECAALRSENSGLHDLLAFAAGPRGSPCPSSAVSSVAGSPAPASPGSPAAAGATPRRRSPLAGRRASPLSTRAGSVAESLERAAGEAE